MLNVHNHMEVALFISIRAQSERSERVQKAQVVAQAKQAQLFVYIMEYGSKDVGMVGAR